MCNTFDIIEAELCVTSRGKKTSEDTQRPYLGDGLSTQISDREHMKIQHI